MVHDGGQAVRLAGQEKLGFFPIPPAAMDKLSAFLRVKDPAAAVIVDPCAGAGQAIGQLARTLSVPPANVWACELDIARGEAAAAQTKSIGNVLAPCDFLTAETSFGFASLVWCNPPYDSEAGGGGREEETFLRHAGNLLAPGGIIMFALPEPVLNGRQDIQDELMRTYDNLFVIHYPPGTRKFNEVCVFGVRKRMRVYGDKANKHWWHAYQLGTWRGEKVYYRDAGMPAPVYEIPPGEQPRRWAKGGLTDAELAIAMHNSPAKKLFAAPGPRAQPRPGLQLGAGQRALVLAGGFLNRVLRKGGPGGQDVRILIKASPFKEQFIKERIEEEVVTKDGPELKVTTIQSERICLRVRVLDQAGKIHDLR